MQDRRSQLQELIQNNMEQSQNAQKTWYDRSAQNQEFDLGDQVFVLLPTSTNKLLAEWQGPYPITKRLGNVNYEVRMTDRRQQKRIFHINMLCAWHAPTAICCWAEEIADTIDEEARSRTSTRTQRRTHLRRLLPTQLTDLRTIRQRFHSVLNS